MVEVVILFPVLGSVLDFVTLICNTGRVNVLFLLFVIILMLLMRVLDIVTRYVMRC